MSYVLAENVPTLTIAHAFEVFVIVLFFVVIVIMLVMGLSTYRKVAEENARHLESLHNSHRDERRDWNEENKQSIQKVEAVMIELTGAIKLANERQTIQVNNNGAMGTQAQQGNTVVSRPIPPQHPATGLDLQNLQNMVSPS